MFEPGPKTRHAAGNDPAKRGQILAGAQRVFMEQGFDAAGVNDICRAAGVSKSTLYVYFAGKEDLFETIVEQERDRLFADVATILTRDAPMAETLRRYGREIATIVCSDGVVRAQRIIIGIAERMPELGARFYLGGAMRAQTDLAGFLTRKVSDGGLTIPDVPLAAAQFIELATATLWKPRLFARIEETPTDAEIDRAVEGAVTVFLAAYDRKGGAAPDR